MLIPRSWRVVLVVSFLMLVAVIASVRAPSLLAGGKATPAADSPDPKPDGTGDYTVYLAAISGKPPTPTATNTALVPAGDFTRGCVDGINENCFAEDPSHLVYLDAFRIDKTEVTNKQYADCVAAGNCTAPQSNISRRFPVTGGEDFEYYGVAQYNNYPVVNITWVQAKTFCAAQGKRLPTSAEWEKAARGADKRSYPWGNTPGTCTLTNTATDGNGDRCEPGEPAAVGSHPTGASPYGVLDMSGNVWEFASDWTGEQYTTARVENPQGPATGISKWILGGSYEQSSGHDLVYLREFGMHTDDYVFFAGFRCAYTVH